MIECKNIWEPILDEFEKAYPYLVNSVDSWYPYSRNEIVIVFKNGDKRIYEYITRKLRDDTFFEDVDMEEEAWKEEFSKRLRNRMWKCGMLRWQLSNKTGISEVMLSRYMNGQAVPSLYNTKKIARALKCPVAHLSEF